MDNKSAYFLWVKSTKSAEDYANFYILDIARHHAVTLSIISDRDGWSSRVHNSDPTEYVESMCHGFQRNSNALKKASIEMVTFEALYRRRCRSPIRWFKVCDAELLGPYLVYEAMEKVRNVQEKLKTSQSRQKS
ncbi:hypothetical protein MTR67_001560 [Solanum verrucosum]|uniref:Uncharacterized protein n=1 Tax=Solanum verrucosum TaxID=315347 RepID=A0AAF0PS30_SOLVR|nr:hypothetical protein MTR67_001560 [Solanum verrucosum]